MINAGCKTHAVISWTPVYWKGFKWSFSTASEMHSITDVKYLNRVHAVFVSNRRGAKVHFKLWTPRNDTRKFTIQNWKRITRTKDFKHKICTWCAMMTSSNENIFRVTGPLCGELTGSGEFPTQRPVMRNYDVFFDLVLKKNGWVNNRGAADLRRYRGHYDVTVMYRIEVLLIFLVIVHFLGSFTHVSIKAVIMN